MDPELPFFIWTSREPYGRNQSGFDDTTYRDEEHNYIQKERRGRKMRGSRREDASIFVAGRSLLPVKNAPALRQRLFRPQIELPDIPHAIL